MRKRRNKKLPLTIAAISFVTAGLLVGCDNTKPTPTPTPIPSVSIASEPVASSTPPPVPVWYGQMWGETSPKGQEHACKMWAEGDADAHADLANAAFKGYDPVTYDEANDWLAFNCSAWSDGTTGNPKPHDHNDGTHGH